MTAMQEKIALYSPKLVQVVLHARNVAEFEGKLKDADTVADMLIRDLMFGAGIKREKIEKVKGYIWLDAAMPNGSTCVEHTWVQVKGLSHLGSKTVYIDICGDVYNEYQRGINQVPTKTIGEKPDSFHRGIRR